jgi:hypothetical protein
VIAAMAALAAAWAWFALRKVTSASRDQGVTANGAARR